MASPNPKYKREPTSSPEPEEESIVASPPPAAPKKTLEEIAIKDEPTSCPKPESAAQPLEASFHDDHTEASRSVNESCRIIVPDFVLNEITEKKAAMKSIKEWEKMNTNEMNEINKEQRFLTKLQNKLNKKKFQVNKSANSLTGFILNEILTKSGPEDFMLAHICDGDKVRRVVTFVTAEEYNEIVLHLGKLKSRRGTKVSTPDASPLGKGFSKDNSPGDGSSGSLAEEPKRAVMPFRLLSPIQEANGAGFLSSSLIIPF
eukprot:g15630.t1